MIGIIDYGAGNLRSVKKALDYLEVGNRIVDSAGGFDGVERVIVPGVGAFGAAIDQLREQGLFEITQAWIASDRPFLGICLGMQLLFEASEEAPDTRGLGVFAGRVSSLRHRRVPQIGWNRVAFRKRSPLTVGLEEGAFFYFLHSYRVAPADERTIVGTTDYGGAFPSIVEQGNVHAVQFHPEKSGDNGLRLLRNWTEL